MTATSIEPEHHWSAPGLNIAATRADAEVAVRLTGELDMANAACVRDAFDRALAADGSAIVVDLRALDFLDSTGIHALLELDRRCRASGRSIDLRLSDGPIRRVLKLSGVLDVLSRPRADVARATPIATETPARVCC